MAKSSEILIAGLTPSFLEKPVLWFSENFNQIKNASKTQSFFKENTLFLSAGQNINFSEFLRKLDELGYQKVSSVYSAGEFSKQGGLIDIFPINSEKIIRLDFFGNKIEEIIEIEPRLIAGEKPKAAKEEYYHIGDFVVHLDHGIGIFKGIKENKYLNIEYAPPKHGKMPDTLLVPLEVKNKINPYLGFETPKIHRLGSPVWGATKKKIKEEVIQFAKELLSIYASREIAKRPPYPFDKQMETELAESFEFNETESQKRANREIAEDLEADKPMDRLVVGDVGFGKTEVAIRAAFRVASAGYQVAVLTPTTILSEQHYQTFKKRLEKFPLNIALLSRLIKKGEEKKILANLKEGKIDIIIGTHRLLSSDIEFSSRGARLRNGQAAPAGGQGLGLLIIDEEQKFGVKQKEKLKKLRSNLDILSLSATPIPRTLSLALSSLRPLSHVDDPPRGRIPIKTFVLPFSEKIIEETIKREIERNGQIFFLHNRVETIEATKKFISNILKRGFKKLPEIEAAHGRLNEKNLLRIMEDFRNGKIKILVATTIIENGLDLANVNTLIVEEASILGLAEAHQLRGRVSRGERQAYAYFLYRSNNLPEKAKERLDALRNMSHLGAGYEIAMKDLEIRGAGNILGAKQSGAINAVGLNLYYQMLSETIEELKDANKASETNF